MEVIQAIEARRSIRKFADRPIPEDTLRAILEAATRAPSGKNQQPWRFVVAGASKRAEMLGAFRAGITTAKARGESVEGAEWTARTMSEAAATVFILNPVGISPWKSHSTEEQIDELVNTQSIGAAIENMLLAASGKGIGSLWICDIFFAYEELLGWLGEDGSMVAAVSLGYPAESPEARPRKALEEVVRFM
jgi:nitroreductase